MPLKIDNAVSKICDDRMSVKAEGINDFFNDLTELMQEGFLFFTNINDAMQISTASERCKRHYQDCQREQNVERRQEKLSNFLSDYYPFVGYVATNAVNFACSAESQEKFNEIFSTVSKKVSEYYDVQEFFAPVQPVTLINIEKYKTITKDPFPFVPSSPMLHPAAHEIYRERIQAATVNFLHRSQQYFGCRPNLVSRIDTLRSPPPQTSPRNRVPDPLSPTPGAYRFFSGE